MLQPERRCSDITFSLFPYYLLKQLTYHMKYLIENSIKMERRALNKKEKLSNTFGISRYIPLEYNIKQRSFPGITELHNRTTETEESDSPQLLGNISLNLVML